MKIAFLGSSLFSKIVLEKLYNYGHEIVCVVSNLDKETGRGKKIKFGKVKSFALEKQIPVLQYKSVSKEGFDDIKAFNPDVLVTASFGQILKQNILDLAPNGVINVHASLLPKYRGSCPVNWCIINGEEFTGVTIMKTNIGLDTGDMILSKAIKILPNENAGELLIRLAEIGAEILIEALNQIENNEAKFIPQKEEESTYFPMLKKDMGKIDFNKNALEISNLCRGLNPWPVCFVENRKSNDEIEIIKVYSSKPVLLENELDFRNFKNGQVVVSNSKKGLVVKCNDGFVLLENIQTQNGKVMDSRAYLNGRKIEVGTCF